MERFFYAQNFDFINKLNQNTVKQAFTKTTFSSAQELAIGIS
ncbi:hypothetical protein [Pedobacter sp.]